MTAELDAYRARVRAVLDRTVGAHAPDWERRRHIPRAGWRALADEGLLCLGHHGADFRRSAIFLEELGACGYAGVRAAIGVHAYMAASYLDLFGTPEQRDRYLAAARSGDRIAALAITESGAGSDLRHLATTARPRADGGYLVAGDKVYVVNGSQADFYVVLARTRAATSARGLTGASLIVVEAADPGVRHVPQPMLGYHGADVCRLELRDVVVPPGRLLGRRDAALTQLIRALDFERLVAGLLAVGGVRHCLDLLNAFVREHRVGDAPLSAKQAVRHQVADLCADFELVRQYAWHVAERHSSGALDTRDAAILKAKATDLALAAAQVTLRYHGAQGYLDDSVASRLYRDAIAGTLAAGANELMRDMIFDTTPRSPSA